MSDDFVLIMGIALFAVSAAALILLVWRQRKLSRMADRLNRAVELAVSGVSPDVQYDETKIGLLEEQLARFLLMEREKQEELSNERDKLKSLIADISHQTKTPVANLILYTELLQEGLAGKPERAMADELKNQGERLRFLVDSLVKMSRLETGVLKMAPAPVELETLLTEAAGTVRKKAEKKGIEIHTKLQPLYCMADAKWLSEAVLNLLDNSIKYTKAGGTITIRTVPYEMFHRIDVEDTGIGIREEEQAQVFGRFYRSSDVRGDEGIGIGLYLTRHIITLQGGYMKLKSEYGKGSCFSIFLQKLKKEENLSEL